MGRDNLLRNEFIVDRNRSSQVTQQIINDLIRLTNGYVQLPNISETRRDVELNLEDKFKNKGLVYWTSNINSIISHSFTEKEIEDSEDKKKLIDIANKMPKTLLSFKRLNRISFRGLKKKINKIKENNDFFKNFDLEKDIADMYLLYLKVIEKYDVIGMYSGEHVYKNQFESIKQELEQLGITNGFKDDKTLNEIESKINEFDKKLEKKEKERAEKFGDRDVFKENKEYIEQIHGDNKRIMPNSKWEETYNMEEVEAKMWADLEEAKKNYAKELGIIYRDDIDQINDKNHENNGKLR